MSMEGLAEEGVSDRGSGVNREFYAPFVAYIWTLPRERGGRVGEIDEWSER